MADRKRTTAQRAVDLVEIENLSLQGKNQAEIAQVLSSSRPYTLSRQQIQYDMRKLEKIWAEEVRVEIDTAKGRALAEIRQLQREYWDAWVRSQQDEETVIKEKQGKDGEGGKAKVQKKTVGQTGDASFLRGVEWCINKRCELLGLDAPKKLDVTWREEIIALIVSGKVTQEQVKQELGDGLATELFESAGISIAKD